MSTRTLALSVKMRFAFLSAYLAEVFFPVFFPELLPSPLSSLLYFRIPYHKSLNRLPSMQVKRDNPSIRPPVPRENRENALLLQSFIQQSPIILVPSAYLPGYPSRSFNGAGHVGPTSVT